jgi:polyisoprenoid-binding protein YceI
MACGSYAFAGDITPQLLPCMPCGLALLLCSVAFIAAAAAAAAAADLFPIVRIPFCMIHTQVNCCVIPAFLQAHYAATSLTAHFVSAAAHASICFEVRALSQPRLTGQA